MTCKEFDSAAVMFSSDIEPPVLDSALDPLADDPFTGTAPDSKTRAEMARHTTQCRRCRDLVVGNPDLWDSFPWLRPQSGWRR